jgi:tetratricopeptide (TPR) repeat protein
VKAILASLHSERTSKVRRKVADNAEYLTARIETLRDAEAKCPFPSFSTLHSRAVELTQRVIVNDSMPYCEALVLSQQLQKMREEAESLALNELGDIVFKQLNEADAEVKNSQRARTAFEQAKIRIDAAYNEAILFADRAAKSPKEITKPDPDFPYIAFIVTGCMGVGLIRGCTERPDPKYPELTVIGVIIGILLLLPIVLRIFFKIRYENLASNANFDARALAQKLRAEAEFKAKTDWDAANAILNSAIQTAEAAQARAIEQKENAAAAIKALGSIRINPTNSGGIKITKQPIDGIPKEITIGEIYEGPVVTVKEFGCFVEIMPGKEGLCHISELADYRVKRTEDEVKVGDIIFVKCIGIDERGKIKLSRKAATKDKSATAAN